MERGRKESNLCMLVVNGVENILESLSAATTAESRFLVVLESVVQSFRAVIIREAKWLMQAF